MVQTVVIKTSIIPIAAAFFSITTLCHPGETEWPQFRGPTGQGLSLAADVPLRWSADTNVAWKVESGRGWSSPVLSGGRLYLTASRGEEGGGEVTLHAVCVNATDGRTLWDTVVFTPTQAEASAMHRKNSLASGTPVVADGKLYVHFGHMGTAALDLAGKVIWRQESVKYQPVHGNGGSPALADGVLVFACDGAKDPFVTGLDAATGAVRWKTARKTNARKPFSFSTPLVIKAGNAQEAVIPGSGFVGAYAPETGREIWRVDYGEGYSVVPRPVLAHGLLFVSSGFDKPVLKAIRPDGAAGDVTDSHVVWVHGKGVPHTGSMLVAGDELYFVSDAGIATCADARTGTVHWSERIGGDNSASPFHAGGRIYFLNEAGTTTVVRAGRKFEVLAKNDLNERTLASCAVADGAIFLRSEKHLWRIGRP